MRFSSITLLIVITVFLATGCVSTPVRESGPFYWPPAPDLPRLKLEARLRSEADLQDPTRMQRLQEFALGQNAPRPAMLKPYDVAAYQGLIAVTDSLAAVVYLIDVPRRRLFPIGWRLDGKLIRPAGVAIDRQRQVYVADSERGEIVVFDGLGLYLRTIGSREQFSRLSDVAVSPVNGDVYALDRGGVDSAWHRILHFDSEGKFLGYIGERGHEPGQFNHPNQMDIGSQGELYVLDAGNFRVQVFSAEGQFLRTWGSVGRGAGQFARPRGIAVGGDDLVMVSDTAFQNFQIFDAQGKLYLAVGSRASQGSPGRYVLPSGLARDEQGFIYVVDQALKSVDVWRIVDEAEAKSVIQ